MALTKWQITDGTKRQMWQNPTTLPFYSWPVAPAWPVVRGGQINQQLYANDATTTLGPQFVFQGLRMYDEPVMWKPDFAYREEPYWYVLPINFVQATVNPPGIILQQLSQAVQNYAFKLRRMTFSWRQGPTNTAPAQTLGVRLFDYQARQLMSDFVNANLLDFNARSNTGSFIFGPHASFPAVPIIYPVNGQIRIDLTDMNATFAGSISDIQGTILFEGVNLIPCDAGSPDPSVIQPSDGGIELMSGKRVYPLPYIYTNNTFNYAANKQTFTSVANFTIPVDGDSDFWITAVHNLKTVVPIPPS